jgi:hypothetical protein
MSDFDKYIGKRPIAIMRWVVGMYSPALVVLGIAILAVVSVKPLAAKTKNEDLGCSQFLRHVRRVVLHAGLSCIGHRWFVPQCPSASRKGAGEGFHCLAGEAGPVFGF